MMNLGLAQDLEEDNPRGGIYFIVEFGTQAFDSKLDFAIDEEITGHFSTDPGISFHPGLGYRHVLGDRISVRYQANILEETSVGFGNLVYDDVVAEHSVEGNLNIWGGRCKCVFGFEDGRVRQLFLSGIGSRVCLWENQLPFY